MQKIILLIFLIGTTAAAYLTYVFLKKYMEPRRSFGRLILFMVTYLLSIMGWVFLFSYVIFYFKDFFFKR